MTMRDRGFGFKAENEAETITVKIQMHWDREVPLDEVTKTLTQAYGEAFSRATDAAMNNRPPT